MQKRHRPPLGFVSNDWQTLGICKKSVFPKVPRRNDKRNKHAGSMCVESHLLTFSGTKTNVPTFHDSPGEEPKGTRFKTYELVTQSYQSYLITASDETDPIVSIVMLYMSSCKANGAIWVSVPFLVSAVVSVQLKGIKAFLGVKNFSTEMFEVTQKRTDNVIFHKQTLKTSLKKFRIKFYHFQKHRQKQMHQSADNASP